MNPALQLLEELQARGVTLMADGDRLRFHPRGKVTPGLLDRLRKHKTEMLQSLAADPLAPPQSIDPAGWVECADGRRGIIRADKTDHLNDIETIDLNDVTPCSRCGLLEAWWGILGGQHCMVCDAAALARSRRLAARAERIRKRYSVVRPLSTKRTVL